MTIEQKLRAIAEHRMTIVTQEALKIAYEQSPYDLGPLRDAVYIDEFKWENNTLLTAIKWGDSLAGRPRGYYPGVLQNDSRYGHYHFVNAIAESIRQQLGGLISG